MSSVLTPRHFTAEEYLTLER
jgi:hypothetical protein